MGYLALIIDIGLAFIPASMADKKGYSFWGFWVFGFFLFLPAIIVAACLGGKNVRSKVNNAPPAPHIAPPATTYVAMPVIYGITGIYAGQSIALSGGKVVFGRDQTDCNVMFPGNVANISRHHCTLSYDGQAVWLTDNYSSNGTFLGNGEKLNSGSRVQILPGQRFYLANTQTMFELR